MPVRTDTFDLGGLSLSSGGGRRLELYVAIDDFVLGGERYRVQASGEAIGSGRSGSAGEGVAPVPVIVDVSRTTGEGYALKLSFEVRLIGPCMRCLEPAVPKIAVASREVYQPGPDQELDSPYLEHGVLDVRAWARDALALSIPTQLLCRPDCAGLCAVCGVDLNSAGPRHVHEREPDARWAKLSEIRFD